MDKKEYEDHWLVQKAKNTAKGVIAAADEDAMRLLAPTTSILNPVSFPLDEEEREVK